MRCYLPLLKDILSFTNEYLDIKSFKDYCPNGLQVEGSNNVEYISSGVSSSLELFEKASYLGSNLVLTHHGLLWGSVAQIISGPFKKRIEFLLKNGISLLAYHLPLDAHKIVGNNSLIASSLELKDIKPFAEYYGNNIGYIGNLDYSIPFYVFLKKVNKLFNSESIYYPLESQRLKELELFQGERLIVLVMQFIMVATYL